MNLLFITSPKGSAIKKEPYDLNYCIEKTLQQTLLWELTKRFIWALISKTKIILSFKNRKTTIATTPKDPWHLTTLPYANVTWGLTALKLGKRLTAAAVSRGKGRKGLISSEGCRGGAGGRTRAGRAGLWHVPPAERRAKGAISDIVQDKDKKKKPSRCLLSPKGQLGGSLEKTRQGL